MGYLETPARYLRLKLLMGDNLNQSWIMTRTHNHIHINYEADWLMQGGRNSTAYAFLALTHRYVIKITNVLGQDPVITFCRKRWDDIWH